MKQSVAAAALCAAFTLSVGAEAVAATEWNVSLWGKRRAFTEHVEKLARICCGALLKHFLQYSSRIKLEIP